MQTCKAGCKGVSGAETCRHGQRWTGARARAHALPKMQAACRQADAGGARASQAARRPGRAAEGRRRRLGHAEHRGLAQGQGRALAGALAALAAGGALGAGVLIGHAAWPRTVTRVSPVPGFFSRPDVVVSAARPALAVPCTWRAFVPPRRLPARMTKVRDS